MEIEFINVQLYDGSVVQFSREQWEFFSWCTNHYNQLSRLKKSRALDIGGSSFEVHLKPIQEDGQIPEVTDIRLHWHG